MTRGNRPGVLGRTESHAGPSTTTDALRKSCTVKAEALGPVSETRVSSGPAPPQREGERPCLWEAVPEAPALALPGEPAGCHTASQLTEALRRRLGSSPPSAGDCAFATVQHQHSCFSHPFTTGPNGVLVRSGEKPRGGPGPLPAFVSSRPDHQVRGRRGGGPRPLEWVLLFMLAAQTLEGKKKALYYSSTHAGCCLHTLPMP